MPDVLAFAADLTAAAGLVPALLGWSSVRLFAGTAPAAPAHHPPITILKPLYGDEPLLEEALASLLAQDYPSFQIVFGLQDAADPARHTIARLRARFPAADFALVVDPTQHGANRKVANLINMLPAARHDILVIADSDVHAPPGYLTQLVAALEQPGIGLVTTLYTALRANESLVARLGAAGINDGFLPSALLARRLGRQDCLGATMALRRDTLDHLGGLAALADHLADDAVLGRRVREQGQGVALARTIPSTTVAESAMADLFAHELRWARTIKQLEPLGFALSAIQYPLAWAVLGVTLAGNDFWSWATLLAIWFLRSLLAASIERTLGSASGLAIWFLPLRDLLSMTVLLASYANDRVAWRGHILRADRPALQGISPRP